MSVWLDPRGCRILRRWIGERSGELRVELKALQQRHCDGLAKAPRAGKLQRRRFIRLEARIAELAEIARSFDRLQRPGSELQPYRNLVQHGGGPEPRRQRLRNRREEETATIEIGAARYFASVGFEEYGRPKEVFLTGAKSGSDMEAILGDAAVVISIALQHGFPAATFACSVGRLPDGGAASVIGAALRLLTAHEAAGEISPEPREE